MPIIQQGNNCLFLNLPKDFVQLLGWAKGTQVIVYPHAEKKKALVLEEIPKKAV